MSSPITLPQDLLARLSMLEQMHAARQPAQPKLTQPKATLPPFVRRSASFLCPKASPCSAAPVLR